MSGTLVMVFVTAGCMLLFCYSGYAEECQDKRQYQAACQRWRKFGYCKPSSPYKSFMRSKCQRTCGSCGLRQSSCSDDPERDYYCRRWRYAGHCRKSSVYFSFMRTKCRKTCGFCGRSSTQSMPTKLPMRDYIRRKPAPKQKKCLNTARYDSLCTNWKLQNFCEPTSKWVRFMKDHCKKTCGFCQANKNLECGLTGRRRGRIIGGNDAVPNHWKWQVALQDSDKFFCGGALIHSRWILTAAHCTYYRTRTINSLQAVLGEHNRNKNEGTEVNIRIKKIINHPAYNERTLENDIALIKLEKDAPLNGDIGLVCLPESGRQVGIGKRCFISGWGKMKNTGYSVPILQEAALPIITQKECEKKNSNPGPAITKKMVCAGHGKGSIISGCHGDSGGPLVCENDRYRYVLEGTVSWGSSLCDSKEKYTVFTRVSEYIGWIKEQIRN